MVKITAHIVLGIARENTPASKKEGVLKYAVIQQPVIRRNAPIQAVSCHTNVNLCINFVFFIPKRVV